MEWKSSFYTSYFSLSAILLCFCVVIIIFIYKIFIDPINSFVDSAYSTKSSAYDANQSLQKLSEGLSLDELQVVSYSVKYIDPSTQETPTSKCQTRGLYLGEADIPFDCETLCESPDFVYKFFSTASFITEHTLLNKKGSYCIPKKVSKCNPFTANTVNSVYDWKCLPKWPSIFGGKDGNEIKTCNGSMIDRLTGQVYNQLIPNNLPLTNPFEEKVSWETAFGSKPTSTQPKEVHRFICTDDELNLETGLPTKRALDATKYDFMHNKYIAPYTFSRFERIRNQCTSLIYNASDGIQPNFFTGNCGCIKGLHGSMVASENTHEENNGDLSEFDPNDIVQRPYVCSPCIGGFSRGQHYVNVPRKCIKSFDTTFRAQRQEKNIVNLLPCGVATFSKPSESCLNGFTYPSFGLSHFAKKLMI
jgi:hypothetical protein